MDKRNKFLTQQELMEEMVTACRWLAFGCFLVGILVGYIVKLLEVIG